MIQGLNDFLSFLALKHIGTEQFAHVNDYSFDAGLELFAGFNVLPKCNATSIYSYSLNAIHLFQMQKSLFKRANQHHLYDKSIINLDFRTVPHFRDESVL
jgi:hypothetical protein